MTLSGIHGLDDVTLTGGVASLTDKNVGLDKPVSVSGLSLAGGCRGQLRILSSTNASATADITPFLLTIGATADNKVYDGTTDAVAHLTNDHILGDVVSTSYTSATFDTPTIGTNKTVTISGIALSGADALNYSAVTSTTATADITNRLITVTATSGQTKVYGDADPVFAYHLQRHPRPAATPSRARSPGPPVRPSAPTPSPRAPSP